MTVYCHFMWKVIQKVQKKNFHQEVNGPKKLWNMHTMVYLLLSNKKEHVLNTCNNMEEYQNHYAKVKKNKL